MKTLTGYLYYPDSLEQAGEDTFCLARSEENSMKFLAIIGNGDEFEEPIFTGTRTQLFPLTPSNARALRKRLPWLRPQPLGLRLSAGFGDRLGLATPGHVRAVQSTSISPIFAQQSVRENARTRRTPQQVMDDAAWGVFQTGWRKPWGADADHLKTTADIDSFYQAGFTFFTIDPGDHVDNSAQNASPEQLKKKLDDLPWDLLETTPASITSRFLNRSFPIEDFEITFSEIDLLRALAKYGQAIAHTVRMARHLAALGGSNCDLEVSVDETETPTSPAEHYFIARELQRLGVQWTSLAPRFVGRFEKGVDYIGDLNQFTAEYSRHAAIARHFGFYRLSLHSGSDKFSIYEAAAAQSRGLIHLKTAGTSYLEALRVVGSVDPDFFRLIYQLARERYEIDRASYHVSAQLEKVPEPGSLESTDLSGLLDQFDARQVFHVTFGAVLDQYGPLLHQVLSSYENEYYAALEKHFIKHLQPLS